MVTGEPVKSVCERYGLPERTAFDWLEDARSSQWVRSAPGDSREVARVELVDLVTQLVAESIRSLVAQSRVAGRDTWIERQDAADLAAYRGVEFDRLIRLLPAFERVAASQPALNEPVDAASRPADDGV